MSEPTAKVEKVFYDQDGVRVTSARFQVGAQTYAMSAVNSVAYLKEAPSYLFSTVLLTFGVIFAVLGGLSAMVMPKGTGPWLTLFLGVLGIAFGVLIRRVKNLNYVVSLTTASGQVQALKSPDQKYIESVVTALNEALVSRG